MIFDISMGLNGIPLCINVKYKGKSFNSIKRELHSILNGIPLIKSNECRVFFPPPALWRTAL
jgi:hypothetical protein